MGADEVEGADRTSASAAQAVRERVEAIRASGDIALLLRDLFDAVYALWAR